MTRLTDREIHQRHNQSPLFKPFLSGSNSTLEGFGRKVPSFGLSSHGYDIRVGSTFMLYPSNSLHNSTWEVTYEDGKQDTIDMFVDQHMVADASMPENVRLARLDNVKELIMPPGGFCLGVSMEEVFMPEDLNAVCMNKSTMARLGQIYMVTPLEAGWRGFVTLEIKNELQIPSRIRVGTGCVQVIFDESRGRPDVTYADRGGKYQDQPNVPVPPIVR